MLNKFLDFLEQAKRRAGPDFGFQSGGASGGWTEQKKKIPSVETFLETPAQTAAKATQQGVAQVEKNKADVKSADEAAKQLVASSPGETSKIAAVTDRYQDTYNKANAALSAYNKAAFGNMKSRGNADSEAMAAYNSPQRGQLMMQQRQAFRLLQGGSFADTANTKAEERQKNAALAQSAMADSAYKQNLSRAAISNANTNVSAEDRKAHESGVAEAYLGMQKKKKDVKIDLNDIHSLFSQ